MTPLRTLTEEDAVEALRSFFRGKPFLVFGTGTSCALDAQFGMSALRDALEAGIRQKTLTGTQESAWKTVITALSDGASLETALDSVNDQGLVALLTEITGSFIAALDRRFGGCPEVR